MSLYNEMQAIIHYKLGWSSHLQLVILLGCLNYQERSCGRLGTTGD